MEEIAIHQPSSSPPIPCSSNSSRLGSSSVFQRFPGASMKSGKLGVASSSHIGNIGKFDDKITKTRNYGWADVDTPPKVVRDVEARKGSATTGEVGEFRRQGRNNVIKEGTGMGLSDGRGRGRVHDLDDSDRAITFKGKGKVKEISGFGSEGNPATTSSFGLVTKRTTQSTFEISSSPVSSTFLSPPTKVISKKYKSNVDTEKKDLKSSTIPSAGYRSSTKTGVSRERSITTGEAASSRRAELLLVGNPGRSFHSSTAGPSMRAASGRLKRKVKETVGEVTDSDAEVVIARYEGQVARSTRVFGEREICVSEMKTASNSNLNGFPMARHEEPSKSSRGLRHSPSHQMSLPLSQSGSLEPASSRRSISPPIQDRSKRLVKARKEPEAEMEKPKLKRVKATETDKETNTVASKKDKEDRDSREDSSEDSTPQRRLKTKSRKVKIKSKERKTTGTPCEADLFYSTVGAPQPTEIQSSQEIQSSPKKASQDTNNGVDDFFASVKQMEERSKSKAEAARKAAIARAAAEPRGVSKDVAEKIEAMSKALQGADDGLVGGLSEEDAAYCAEFRHPTALCPFCSEPLPLNPSTYLSTRLAHLRSISVPSPTRTNPDARYLAYQRHADVCLQHEHEITTIPLGVRAEYPKHHNFGKLLKRLTTGWVGKEVEHLTRDPERSRFFDEVVAAKRKGLRGRLEHQFGSDCVTSVRSGYYGDLGAQIIRSYFEHLHKTGNLELAASTCPSYRSGDTKETTYSKPPMTVESLINYVLIPETCILLIMEDLECGEGDLRIGKKLREKAVGLWKESGEYGRWAFREDGEEAERVLLDIQKVLDGMKRPANSIRSGRKDTGIEVEVIVVSDDEAEERDATDRGRHGRVIMQEVGTGELVQKGSNFGHEDGESHVDASSSADDCHSEDDKLDPNSAEVASGTQKRAYDDDDDDNIEYEINNDDDDDDKVKGDRIEMLNDADGRYVEISPARSESESESDYDGQFSDEVLLSIPLEG